MTHVVRETKVSTVKGGENEDNEDESTETDKAANETEEDLV
jgi:hypothetical protein